MLKRAIRTNLLQINASVRAKFCVGTAADLSSTYGELQMFRSKLFFSLIMMMMLSLAACQSDEISPLSETSPNINVSNDGNTLNVLQEKPYGSGQLLLTSWQDENGASCLAGTYFTRINETLQPHNIAVAGCQAEGVFQAAYSGNSRVEQFAGAPRHTAVFGRSDIGHAVRIVWHDGLVDHVPLENHSFLEARDGTWAVDRIELLDDQNNIILAEEWTGTGMQATN